ncbi:MAG: hemolysin family protein [Acidimicrobiales bacterium]
MNSLLVLLLVLIMVGFNALYVAAEFAAVGSRRSRVQERAETGSGAAASLLTVLQDPKRLDNYVAACQIGITLSSLVAGAYGQAQLTPLFDEWLGSAGSTVSILMVLLSITSLQVVLGELLPKTVALRYPEVLAISTLTPMKLSQWLFHPLVTVFNGSAFAIMQWLGLTGDHSHSHVHSPQELAGLYRASADGGLIDSSEREMLAGALTVKDRLVREIMTPRRRLVTVDLTTVVADALTELAATPFSRFPVTDGGDEIVGVVTLRQLFNAAAGDPDRTVGQIHDRGLVVSEVVGVPELMTLFTEDDSHTAIVVNEFGTVSGFVTREDAIEEIFGEFYDEFDVEPDPITIQGDRVSLRGDVLLSVLNDRFQLSFPTGYNVTVSGYVWHCLGRLPRVGDEVPLPSQTASAAEAIESDSTESPSLRVDSVDGTLVDRVSFEHREGPPS